MAVQVRNWPQQSSAQPGWSSDYVPQPKQRIQFLGLLRVHCITENKDKAVSRPEWVSGVTGCIPYKSAISGCACVEIPSRWSDIKLLTRLHTHIHTFIKYSCWQSLKFNVTGVHPWSLYNSKTDVNETK